MPGMNGEELYREIQKLDQDLAKRIIFISGVANDFLNSFGDMFLPKPFNLKELIKIVKRPILYMINHSIAKRVRSISGVENDFLKSHGNMFLPKPFTAKGLIEAVRKLIS